jgi:hypothetical protein
MDSRPRNGSPVHFLSLSPVPWPPRSSKRSVLFLVGSDKQRTRIGYRVDFRALLHLSNRHRVPMPTSTGNGSTAPEQHPDAARRWIPRPVLIPIKRISGCAGYSQQMSRQQRLSSPLGSASRQRGFMLVAVRQRLVFEDQRRSARDLGDHMGRKGTVIHGK